MEKKVRFYIGKNYVKEEFMTEKEKKREKELKRLLREKAEIIREAKKELIKIREELTALGNNKNHRR